MKKIFLLILLLVLPFTTFAADLLEVYQQAQASDPIFQQAIAQRFSTKEGVPISVSALLPNISLQATPSISRLGYAGTNYSSIITNTPGFFSPRNNTQRAYTLTLTATQTVFNFAQFSTVANAVALSKSADATLNAALQDLMVRVAKAYFAVLQDEENVSYSEASKLFNQEQLDQVKQQYRVGLKTLTDMYTAQASYDTAVANYIAAQTALANDKENLRVITGRYYPRLSQLSDHFPLISPKPASVENWVQTAMRQNWSIKSFQYQVDASRQLIRQQFAGHLPNVTLDGTVSRSYTNNLNGYATLNVRSGPGTISEKSIGLTVNVPIFAGGGVMAQTKQAIYNFEIAQQQLEQTVRGTLNQTRQNYLNVIAGISKVSADKQAVKSNLSSLAGMEASYRVGTETLVDVLNQQKLLFQAQLNYAQDRYAFVNNFLALKQAAGTLSFNDLRAVNVWLMDKQRPSVSKKALKAELKYTYPKTAMDKNETKLIA